KITSTAPWCVSALLAVAVFGLPARSSADDGVVVRARKPVTDAADGDVHVDEAHLKAKGPASVPDALRFEPGVSIQQTTPGQGSVYLRGLSGRDVAHYVDGVRLNSTIFREGNNPYLGLVDPLAIDRVDYSLGPSSALYGSGALGGALRFHTTLPGYRLGETKSELRTFQRLG